MTLQSSGPISLQDIADEAGESTPHSLRSLAALFNLGTPDLFSDFYGLSYAPEMTIDHYTMQTYTDGGYYIAFQEYDITCSGAWYAVVDSSEIGNLDFSPASGGGGTDYNCYFTEPVDNNPTMYTRGGGVSFYLTSNNAWLDNLGACQDGYAETCG